MRSQLVAVENDKINMAYVHTDTTRSAPHYTTDRAMCSAPLRSAQPRKQPPMEACRLCNANCRSLTPTLRTLVPQTSTDGQVSRTHEMTADLGSMERQHIIQTPAHPPASTPTSLPPPRLSKPPFFRRLPPHAGSTSLLHRVISTQSSIGVSLNVTPAGLSLSLSLSPSSLPAPTEP